MGVPLISVVIPTLDEEGALPSLLEVLKRHAPDAELVVSDGGSLDGTQAAARAGAHVLVKCSKPGRAFQLDQGLRAAAAPIVLFLHADTRLPDDWPALLSDAFSGLPTPAAASFRLCFDSPLPVYRALERAAAWRQSLTGVPQGDQGIAVDREAYLACGGFPFVALMEEYELYRRLRPHGRFVNLDAAAVTSVRRYEKGPLLQALRNSTLIARWYLGVPPDKLARSYR